MMKFQWHVRAALGGLAVLSVGSGGIATAVMAEQASPRDGEVASHAVGHTSGVILPLKLEATPALSGQPREYPLPTLTEEGIAAAGALSLGEKQERQLAFEAAMAEADEREKLLLAAMKMGETGAALEDAPIATELDGSFAQGGLVFGQTQPGAQVRLDGQDVFVDAEGRFVIGFGRDSALSASLEITRPDGGVEQRALAIEDRAFKVQRIDGLDQSKVSGFTEEQLAKIGIDREKKKTARAVTAQSALWKSGFDWPLTGRISGVFGSQRILNGEAKRPHSGVDIARPTGTEIKAPADGVITLAETDMYFEGGLVLLDHGHWLESAFLHMSRIDVEPGQQVKKGDVVGAVGATGRATGPHLHWSVKWVGRLVDPQLLVGEMPEAQE